MPVRCARGGHHEGNLRLIGILGFFKCIVNGHCILILGRCNSVTHLISLGLKINNLRAVTEDHDFSRSLNLLAHWSDPWNVDGMASIRFDLEDLILLYSSVDEETDNCTQDQEKQ